MKQEVENDLVNQVPNPVEQPLPESNIQPTMVPEQPVMVNEPSVGTPTPAKKNTFVEKLSALKAKLFSHGVGSVVAIGTVAVVAIAILVFGIIGASPKQVFKGTINKAFKEVEKSIDVYDKYMQTYDIQEKALLANFDMTLDTNIKEIKDELGFDIKKLSLGAEVGLDLPNEMVHAKAEIKGDKEKLDATLQVIDDKMYVSSSLLDEVITSSEKIGLDFGEIKQLLEEFEKEYSTDPEDYKYLVKTVRKALNKAISSEHMEKEKVELDLGKDSFKATKYSYVFDDKAVQELVEAICEYLLEDDDFVKVLSDVTGLDKGDIKDVLKEAKKSADDIEFEDEFIFNLYTKGLFNKSVGFSFEFDGKEYVTYVYDGKDAEMVIDNHIDDEYSQMKVVVTLEEDGKEQALTVKYNGEKIVTGTVRELTNEVIDMTVNLEVEGVEAAADIYLSAVEKDEKISGKYEFKLEVDKEYISVKGNYGIAAQKKLTKVNTKNTVDVTEFDSKKLEEEILNRVEKDSTLSSIYELGMEAYEEEVLDLNYDGMLEIDQKDVAAVFQKTRPTVLYVGEDYYSSYSEVDAYNMFENLLKAQTELDFYSHYLDTYYSFDSAAFEALVADVQHTCKTTAPTQNPTADPNAEAIVPVECQKYPAIYLIKDGKVQKAFRGTVTLEELKTALKDLGI